MAKWNDNTQILKLNQDDRVFIYVEGVGDFLIVDSSRNDDDSQELEIYEYLNEEVIYQNTIPAE